MMVNDTKIYRKMKNKSFFEYRKKYKIRKNASL